MKLILANDHAAVRLKEEVKSWLKDRGHEVVDLGVGPDEKVDYPDKGAEAARIYLEGGFDFGVILCGTGIGISIAANKVQGIRCALPQNSYAAAMAREHNNCQFIAFGARIDYPEKTTAMLEAFLNARFDTKSHHADRVRKLMDIERGRLFGGTDNAKNTENYN